MPSTAGCWRPYPLDTAACATPLALDRSPNVICLEKYLQLRLLVEFY